MGARVIAPLSNARIGELRRAICRCKEDTCVLQRTVDQILGEALLAAARRSCINSKEWPRCVDQEQGARDLAGGYCTACERVLGV